MHFKHKLVCVVLSCVLMLSGAVLLMNVTAQAPQKAQIAFTSNRDGNWEIYVMDADGNNQRRLTNNPATDREPAWSPDGKMIAFTSNIEIYIMDADDGNNQRNLTNNPSVNMGLALCPAWSPDGKMVAFTAFRDGNAEIYVMDADDNNPRNLTNNPAEDWFPDWFDPASAYAVSSAGKLRGTWGWLKQTSR